MQSEDFVTGVSGWQIQGNGDVEFGDGKFRGDITGASGTFSGTVIVGSLNIPDTTTADSFHVETDGDTYWGCNAADFLLDNNNATAYVLKTGVAKFQNSVLSGSVSINDIVAGSEIAIQGWQSTLVFASSDYRTVGWSTGNDETITLLDGTVYTITAGNTGSMAALTYIYLDIAVSTTALQTTTTAATAVGTGKILIGVAQNNSDISSSATYQVYGGSGGQLMTVDNIAANSTSTNEFISNTAQIADATITNAKINDLSVAKLTTGTISSKAITLAVAAGTGDSKIQAGKTDFWATKILGSATTGFDITNPSGATFRYTYDYGTDPEIETYVSIGDTIAILLYNYASAGNNGIFTVTGVGTGYFEVSNTSGVAENNVEIGDEGKLEVGQAGFILGVDDSDSDRSKFFIGNYDKYLEWNGETLNLKGSLNTTDFRWTTVFESIDGYQTGGVGTELVEAIPTGVKLQTGTSSNDSATLLKQFGAIPYFMTWDKRRTLRMIINIKQDSSIRVSAAFGDIGTNQRQIGVYQNGNQLKGRVADGTGTTDIYLLNPITVDTDYVIDIKFFPGERCEFYVDGEFVGLITTNLPSGDSDAERILQAECITYTNALRRFDLKLWEIWQEN